MWVKGLMLLQLWVGLDIRGWRDTGLPPRPGAPSWFCWVTGWVEHFTSVVSTFLDGYRRKSSKITL